MNEHPSYLLARLRSDSFNNILRERRSPSYDLAQLVDTHPQLLGICIDEATAIIVQKSKAKIVGRGKVHFYDRTQPVVPDKPDFIALGKGAEYDLAERKVLEESESEPE